MTKITCFEENCKHCKEGLCQFDELTIFNRECEDYEPRVEALQDEA